MSISKHSPASDEHLQRCWVQQYCGPCLNQDKCSWCPFTQTCVPNTYDIQALAPAYDADICPHWAERWDIRTRPLGCQVSTITSLTCVISVLSTLAFLLLSWLAIRGIQRFGDFNKKYPAWWRLWDYEWPAWVSLINWAASTGDDGWDGGQRQPLLGTAGGVLQPPPMHPAPARPDDGGSGKDDSDMDDDAADDDDDDDTDSDSS